MFSLPRSLIGRSVKNCPVHTVRTVPQLNCRVTTHMIQFRVGNCAVWLPNCNKQQFQFNWMRKLQIIHAFWDFHIFLTVLVSYSVETDNGTRYFNKRSTSYPVELIWSLIFQSNSIKSMRCNKPVHIHVLGFEKCSCITASQICDCIHIGRGLS